MKIFNKILIITVLLGINFLAKSMNQVPQNHPLLQAALARADLNPENNANQAGSTNGEGAYISATGTGWIPSYAVVNLQGTYRLGKSVDLFARIVNVLDKQYSTAGFLTTNTFSPNGAFRANPDELTHENAVSPGTPRALWAGVRLHFD